MTVASLSGAGLRHLNIYQLYTSGLPYATVAGDEPYSGVQVDIAKNFRPTIPESQVIQITGDDRPGGQIVLAANETVNAEIVTGKLNLTVDALVSGVNVVTQGDQKFILRETENRGCEGEFGIMAYQQAIDNVIGSATRGNTVYHACFIPKARIVPLGGVMEEGNALETRYMSYASVVTTHLWGMGFISGTEGATEGQLVEGIFNGPPVLDTWLINAAPLLILNLSETALADEAGTDFDVQIFLWANATGVRTNITATATITSTVITVVGAVEDDIVTAIYSKAGCP